MKRRFFLQATSAAIALPGLAIRDAFAQEKYPNKPITIVVAYAAGGSADSRTRQLGRYMSNVLGQPIIVENKPGAGGNIGTGMVARAKPDGYTIGMGNFGPLAVNKAMFEHMNFDPVKDIAPVALIERGPVVLVVHPNSRFKSVKDIIAAAKAEPGKLTYASAGLGGTQHLVWEMLAKVAGVSFIHVPYKGGAPATADLQGGHVDMMFEQMYAATPALKAGRLRVLAIASAARSPQLPDVPTMAEAGVPGFGSVENWQGFIAPANTPPAIIRLLNKVTNQALTDPSIKQRILDEGNDVGGGTPEQFGQLIASEAKRWGQLVRSAKITVN